MADSAADKWKGARVVGYALVIAINLTLACIVVNGETPLYSIKFTTTFADATKNYTGKSMTLYRYLDYYQADDVDTLSLDLTNTYHKFYLPDGNTSTTFSSKDEYDIDCGAHGQLEEHGLVWPSATANHADPTANCTARPEDCACFSLATRDACDTYNHNGLTCDWVVGSNQAHSTLPSMPGQCQDALVEPDDDVCGHLQDAIKAYCGLMIIFTVLLLIVLILANTYDVKSLAESGGSETRTVNMLFNGLVVATFAAHLVTFFSSFYYLSHMVTDDETHIVQGIKSIGSYSKEKEQSDASGYMMLWTMTVILWVASVVTLVRLFYLTMCGDNKMKRYDQLYANFM